MLQHLPPGIEGLAREAVLALASCKGLAPTDLQTIQYCIAVCPRGFERVYTEYFASLEATRQPQHSQIC
jgi:hypothetical protein